jgi:hypothetical protein
VRKVSSPPGKKYSWRQLPEAIRALEGGQDIDYQGASGPINIEPVQSDAGGNPTAGYYDVFGTATASSRSSARRPCRGARHREDQARSPEPVSDAEGEEGGDRREQARAALREQAGPPARRTSRARPRARANAESPTAAAHRLGGAKLDARHRVPSEMDVEARAGRTRRSFLAGGAAAALGLTLGGLGRAATPTAARAAPAIHAAALTVPRPAAPPRGLHWDFADWLSPRWTVSGAMRAPPTRRTRASTRPRSRHTRSRRSSATTAPAAGTSARGSSRPACASRPLSGRPATDRPTHHSTRGRRARPRAGLGVEHRERGQLAAHHRRSEGRTRALLRLARTG